MVESVESVLEENEHIIFVFDGRLLNGDILYCVVIGICIPVSKKNTFFEPIIVCKCMV